MGLDQYAWAQRPEVAPLELITERQLTDSEFEAVDKGKIDLCQWRKHADLNAWMTDLYERKGGTEEFNCITMPLVRDDLLSLRQHIETHNGYEVRGEGFFWGTTRPEDIERDKEFIKNALNALDEGYEVFYSCWY
jgi:hypothetical protein